MNRDQIRHPQKNKGVKYPWYAWGMFKLRFDRYISDNAILVLKNVEHRPVARISYGEVRLQAVGTNQRAPQAQARREVWGYSAAENVEKFDCLRQHLVRL